MKKFMKDCKGLLIMAPISLFIGKVVGKRAGLMAAVISCTPCIMNAILGVSR